MPMMARNNSTFDVVVVVLGVAVDTSLRIRVILESVFVNKDFANPTLLGSGCIEIYTDCSDIIDIDCSLLERLLDNYGGMVTPLVLQKYGIQYGKLLSLYCRMLSFSTFAWY
jgi:hypothetical protein